MKPLFRTSSHQTNRSHDCLIAEIKGKIVKITYEAYNAVEKCNTEFFDGNKWNHILSMLDMGHQPMGSAYNILDEGERLARAEGLFKTSELICNKII